MFFTIPAQVPLDLITLGQSETPQAGELAFGEVVLRISLAAALCFLVGWERKIADKPAGRRTMALIGAGAAAFTVMGVQIASQIEYRDGLQLDPTRVLAYIISGVGFLGAGAILHSKRGISGLTTAAAIWASAGIGAACGLGLFKIVIALFGVVFCVLWLPWMTGIVGNGEGEYEADENGVEN
ncbi:MAG: MgtC/SapB family protein [Phycisphaera sp.]|nr:MAG: MgtC/SapB family protein [Phycisphaera sp.]